MTAEGKMPPRALTIAGSDSGGGAGIQADLKTFHSFGCFGMSAVTAITAQNSLGVQAVQPVPAEFVARQLESVLGDIGADALKCGMLANAEVVGAVAGSLERFPEPPLVLDTVLIAKSGDPLLADDAVDVMVEKLFPRALLVTPNLDEAERLAGFTVRDQPAMERAARELARMGASAVLIKGGHLEGPELVDLLLLPDGRTVRMTGQRIDTPHTHGTGCVLSAAVAACLARGMELEAAVRAARKYLMRGIRESFATGGGYGTLNHRPVEED